MFMQDMKSKLSDLAKFAENSNVDNHSELLDLIADLFFATSKAHGQKEIEVFGAALEKIVFKLNPDDRARLSKRFADKHNAPRSLIRKLAMDEIDVAEPILSESPCLSEEELIELARTLDQAYLVAIAGREKLPCELTEIIVDRGEEHVLECVTKNEGAGFSDRSLEKLCESAGKNRKLFSAFAERGDVPDELLSTARRSISALNALEMETFAAGRRPRSDIITGKMLAHFAHAKMVPETVLSLSLLTGHPEIFVKHCLLEASVSVFAQLCKANGFDTATYAALLKLRSQITTLHGQTIVDAIRSYRRLPRREAQRALGYEEGEEDMIT